MTTPSKPLALDCIGDFEVLEVISQGGMGTVYKCQSNETKEIVAVKEISPEIANNPTLLKRFERECSLANQVEHPNIVKMLGYYRLNGNPILVMEFIDGESVADKLDREVRIKEEEAIAIIGQVCQALQAAHSNGLIHRDIKPDNILLTKEGQAKLTDLGLAKGAEQSMDLTRTGSGLGTPNFMPPEQFRNAKNVDHRCDIYALAATLYQMVTGVLPFGDDNLIQLLSRKMKEDLPPPRQLVPELSVRVDQAIRRAMRTDPGLRHESCEIFRQDLLGLRSEPLPEAGKEQAWSSLLPKNGLPVEPVSPSQQQATSSAPVTQTGIQLFDVDGVPPFARGPEVDSDTSPASAAPVEEPSKSSGHSTPFLPPVPQREIGGRGSRSKNGKSAGEEVSIATLVFILLTVLSMIVSYFFLF